ncbi:hypothetical protein ACFVH6_41890 [Spirillospora sp. NPDC127200]
MSTPRQPRVPYWCDPHPAHTDLVPRDGRRHLGVLEEAVRRQWDPADGPPPASLITAVDRLAALPGPIASQVAEALRPGADGTGGLWLGDGDVPDLDHLGHLSGVPVRPGAAATWDQVPGATVWERRTVVIGTGGHVSVSLIDHEIGHVLACARGAVDTGEWTTIMYRCRPLLEVERWHDPHEWWAEAWAFVATKQFGWLLRTLGGHEQVAEMVVSYYVRHYGLEV